MSENTVTLCGQQFEPVAQKQAYLLHHFRQEVGAVVDSLMDLTADTFLGVLYEREYEAFCLLIPGDETTPGFRDRVPEWLWDGHSGPERGEYDPKADQSPTEPEKIAALEVLVRVNRLDALAPKLLMEFMRELDKAEGPEAASPSTTPASSPSPKDGPEGLTSSGTGPPTLVLREDSPFPVYTG